MKLLCLIIVVSLIACLFFSNLANGQVPEGAVSAPNNIRANDYPCILPDFKVMFKVKAPDAHKVQIDLGKLYDMLQYNEGNWTLTTETQVPESHYYSLVIDSF